MVIYQSNNEIAVNTPGIISKLSQLSVKAADAITRAYKDQRAQENIVADIKKCGEMKIPSMLMQLAHGRSLHSMTAMKTVTKNSLTRPRYVNANEQPVMGLQWLQKVRRAQRSSRVQINPSVSRTGKRWIGS